MNRKNSKRKTWTFEPAKDVKKLVRKKISELKKVVEEDQRRGLRTKLINQALRLALGGADLPPPEKI